MADTKPIIELEFYIIRHGQSQGNIERVTDGLSVTDLHDPRLTELGKKQAIACGERFKNTEFDAVYSSALLRAVETATEIIKKQPSEKTLKVLPLLTEAGVSEEYCHSSFDEINKASSSNRRHFNVAKEIAEKVIKTYYFSQCQNKKIINYIDDFLPESYTKNRDINKIVWYFIVCSPLSAKPPLNFCSAPCLDFA